MMFYNEFVSSEDLPSLINLKEEFKQDEAS